MNSTESFMRRRTHSRELFFRLFFPSVVVLAALPASCGDDVQFPEPVMSGRWDVILRIYDEEPGTWQLQERAEELSGLASVLDAELAPASGWVELEGNMELAVVSPTRDELRFYGRTNAARDSAWGSVAHVRGDTLAVGMFTARKRPQPPRTL